MAYFDSPKNKALWNKELNELKKQRELRAQGLENAATEKAVKHETKRAIQHEGPEREKISYKELLAEETASIQNAKKSKIAEKKLERQRETTVDLHLKGPSL